MFRSVFRADSWLWKPFGWLADLLLLSTLWLVCCLPVVTVGAATAALYDAIVRCFRRKESDYLARFFETFKNEWKRGILPTLLWAAILAGLILGYSWFTGTFRGDWAVMTAVGLLVLLCIPVGACCWVFPLLSRFTLSFGQLNGNAVRLALGHLPSTFAMALAVFGCVWLTWRLLFLPLLLLPALLMLFWSLFMEPVFRKYEEEQEK